MTMRTTLTKVFLQEDINFLLTNRIPRRLLTRFMGWFSKIEQPLVRDASIALWQVFSDLDLSEARRKQFKSVHDCFTRELKDRARPIDCDPQVVETRLCNRDLLTLVPVAAILVASIRLNCVDAPLNLAYRGPNLIPCSGHYEKGDEMGWFEHGSTIVVLAPGAWSFAESVDLGGVIRMGQPLFRMPAR